MRTNLDCAVLIPNVHAHWMNDWMAEYRDRQGRVRWWPMALDDDGDGCGPAAGGVPPMQVLARLVPTLRRYDACLLPVTPRTLAWTRMTLAHAQNAWPVPLLALARDLKAAALDDLLALGLDDFMRDTACADEIAARMGQGRRRQAVARPAAAPAAPPCQASVAESLASYAQAPFASRASAAPAMAPGLAGPGAPAQAGAEAGGELSFRAAKTRVVVAFERQYIHDALARSSGNIAVASRAARKHRRAFWALMRKHKIDAAPYREAAQARQAKLP